MFEEEINIHDLYIDMAHNRMEVFPEVICLINPNNVSIDKKFTNDHFRLLMVNTISKPLNHIDKKDNNYIYAFYNATTEGLFALKWIDVQTKKSIMYIGVVVDEVNFSIKDE